MSCGIIMTRWPLSDRLYIVVEYMISAFACVEDIWRNDRSQYEQVCRLIAPPPGVTDRKLLRRNVNDVECNYI